MFLHHAGLSRRAFALTAAWLLLTLAFAGAAVFGVADGAVRTHDSTTFGASAAGARTDSSTVGLVGYWPFDEGSGNVVMDHSGNENNGQVLSATWTQGVQGGAIDFNGSTSYVLVPYNASLDTPNALTLECWVKPRWFYSGDCQGNDLISNDAFSYWGSYNLRYYDNWFDNSCGIFTPNKEKFQFLLHPTHTGAISENVIMTAQWYHIVGTYDGHYTRLYVNAIQEGTTEGAGTLGSPPNDLTIGRNMGHGYPYWVNGIIDEVRIYNRALSPSEIRQHYLAACPAGRTLEVCRTAETTSTLLFGLRTSRDAEDLGPPGRPAIFDSSMVTITRSERDLFYLSSSKDTLAPLVCDDAIYVNETGIGLGPYTVIDPDLPLCRPMEEILQPLPGPDITHFIPMGTSCVRFDLADTQRLIFGNTDIFLVKEAAAGPVAYWSFDEGSGTTAFDYSGFGRQGEVVGAAWIPGARGHALQFRGEDYVNINTSQVLPVNAPAFSIAAWVKTSKELGTVFIQSAQPGVTGSDGNHFLTATQFDEYPPTGGETWLSTNILDDRWHHLAVVVAGGDRTLYVDGTMEVMGPQEVYGGSTPTATRIGDREGWMPEVYGFAGGIDEVRVYDRALRADEIQAIYSDHSLSGRVRGTVSDVDTAQPVSGATVEARFGEIIVGQDETDGAGNYTIELQPGDYVLRISKEGYFEKDVPVVITPTGDLEENVVLVRVCWPYMLSSIDFDGFDRTNPGSATAHLKLRSTPPVTGTLLPGGSDGWSIQQQSLEAADCNSEDIVVSTTPARDLVKELSFDIRVGENTVGARHEVVADYPILQPTDLDVTDWGGYGSLSGLLKAFAPVLKFNEGERYFPVRVEVSLYNASLRAQGDGHPNPPPPDMADLKPEDLARYSWSFFNLDLPCDPGVPDGCADAYLAAVHVTPNPHVVYASAVRDRGLDGRVSSDDLIVLQYWMNYYFNDMQTDLYCDPLKPVREVHEGDWEQVSVALKPDLTAQAVSYGGHGRTMEEWAHVEKYSDQNNREHPIVFVGRGGHANYAHPAVECIWPAYPLPFYISEHHLGDGPVFSPRGLGQSGEHPYDIEVLPRWTNLAQGDPNRWIEFSGYWTYVPGFSWRGPAFRKEWSNPVGELFQDLQIEARGNVDITLVDPLGRTATPLEIHIPYARYETYAKTVGTEVGRAVRFVIPYAVAGAYQIALVPFPLGKDDGRSPTRDEGTYSLWCTRHWPSASPETTMVAEDVPIGEVPPEGYQVTPDIPRVGASIATPEYWNLDWDVSDSEAIEWRLAPSEVPFDPDDIIPESLRLNGTVEPVLPLAYEDSVLVVRFARGAAIHSISDAEPNTYVRVLLTGMFTDSIRLESPATVRLITTAGAGGGATGPGRFRVEFPHGNICTADGVDFRVVLPQAGRLQVWVFDVSGRLVRGLVDRQYQPGSYPFHWDGKNSTGSRSASGMYFVRTVFANEARAARVVMIR